MSYRLVFAAALAASGTVIAAEGAKAGPVKVFVLAGQSNMQGHAHVRTIDWLGEDPVHGGLLKKLKKADGSWVEREDVWIYYNRGRNQLKKGNLTGGYGASDNELGPELMFGHIMGDRFENQVLLIKTAWGGQSLAVDFRPPSAGDPPYDAWPKDQAEKLKANIAAGKVSPGAKYREMIEEVRKVLADPKAFFPDYAGQGVELTGFVWFQGWNDMINAAYTAEYEKNMVAFINDVRRDLKAPKLPFVIAVMGVDGKSAGAGIQTFRKAQTAAGAHPEFQGNVACVQTADYWDEAAGDFLKKNWINRKWSSPEAQAKWDKMGSQPPYHYLGSAKILSLIGWGCGEAMNGLLGAAK